MNLSSFFKRFRKAIILTITFVFAIGLFVYQIFLEPFFTKRSFEKIEVGMSIEEVKELVGEPLALDTSNTYFKFIMNTDNLKSDIPVIYFDSLHKVTGKDWGDD